MANGSEIYTNAGYGMKSVGFGKSPALLLVDFQKAFTDDLYPDQFVTNWTEVLLWLTFD